MWQDVNRSLSQTRSVKRASGQFHCTVILCRCPRWGSPISSAARWQKLYLCLEPFRSISPNSLTPDKLMHTWADAGRFHVVFCSPKQKREPAKYLASPLSCFLILSSTAHTSIRAKRVSNPGNPGLRTAHFRLPRHRDREALTRHPQERYQPPFHPSMTTWAHPDRREGQTFHR